MSSATFRQIRWLTAPQPPPECPLVRAIAISLSNRLPRPQGTHRYHRRPSYSAARSSLERARLSSKLAPAEQTLDLVLFQALESGGPNVSIVYAASSGLTLVGVRS